LDAAKSQFLKSGVEHWKSNYKHQVDVRDIVIQDINNSANNPNAGPLSGTSDQIVVGEHGKSATLRSNSAINKPSNLYRPAQPEWSKNDFAHFNKAPIGVTDYKFNYGEKIGHAPKPHIMDEESTSQPRIYHPLK